MYAPKQVVIDSLFNGMLLTGRETTADLRLIVINVAKPIRLILSNNDLVHVFRAFLGIIWPGLYVSDKLTRRHSTIRQEAAILKRDGLIGGHTVRDGLICVTLICEPRKRPINSIFELERLVRGEMDIATELDTLHTLQSVPITVGNK